MTIKRLWGVIPLLLAVGWASGCAVSQPEPSVVRAPELGQEIPAYQVPETPDEVPKFVEPSGGLTLKDALSAALVNNPRLAVFSWTVRVKEAEALQAKLRPNPELTAELENFAGSGDLSGLDGAETTVALSQLLELGGKRGKRLTLASRERDLAAWDYEATRVDVFTETAKAFANVLAAQQRLLLADELVEVAEDVLASVSRRVKAGSVSPVEESRARVEVATSRVDRNRVARELRVEQRRLASLWGSSQPQFLEAVGELETTKDVPELDALRELVLQTPELARWATELEQRQAALALARADGKPDLTVGAGVRRFGSSSDDATALVVGVGIPLPIFNRNQGATKAAEFRLQRAAQERRNATVRVEAELATKHEMLLALESEVTSLRDDVLPEANTAFNTAQQAYSRGAMRFTDVLDTERQLFELRGRYFSSLAEHHGAVADIERLIGESLEAAIDNAETP